MRFTISLRWKTVKGKVEKNPVFHLKAGFFIVQAAEKTFVCHPEPGPELDSGSNDFRVS